MLYHDCHANGCEEEDAHHELPFCRRHFNMLPVPHRNKLWEMRSRGECGVCIPKDAIPEFLELANLGIAIIHYLEWGDHDCPDELCDDGGFCWGCGIQGPDKVFRQAKVVEERFNL
jgi:hypothetical protein